MNKSVQDIGARFYPFPNLPFCGYQKAIALLLQELLLRLASQLYDAFNQALAAFVPVEVGVLGGYGGQSGQ